MKEYTIKPNRKAYFTLPFIRGSIALFIVFLIIGFIGHLVWNAASYVIVLILFIALRGFSFYARKVSYDKLTYTFTAQKIIAKGGGIFSDFESELAVRNITHVRKVLPFIQHYFYRTGNIIIDSAGSGTSEIMLEAIDTPGNIFNYVQRLMRGSGFSMSASEMKMERSPNTTAVLLQIVGGYISGIFAFLVFGVPFFLGSFGALMGAMEELGPFFPVALVLLGLIVLGILIAIPVSFYINYSEQKRRTYRVYNDMVTYYEGFLTKVDAVLPMENLSDTSLTQTFVDKILDLADVKVSCLGSGQEVHFRNIRDGKGVSDAIDEASSAFKSLVGTDRKAQQPQGATQQAGQRAAAGQQDSTQGQAQQQQQQYTQAAKPSPVTRDKEFTAEYGMDMKRTMVPLLALLPLCLLFPPLFLTYLFVYLRTKATKFLVKAESIAREYSLFSTNTQEFSADKVTGVVLTQGLLDRLFETCTVQFWSVGSGQNVVFSNVKRELVDFDKILAKAGVYPKDATYTIQSQFRFSDYLKRSLFGYLYMLAVVLVIVIVFVLPMMVGGAPAPVIGGILGGILGLVVIGAVVVGGITIFFDKKRADFSMVAFCGDHVYCQKGFLKKSYYYALYDNVKDITTKRYPFSQNGTLKFNVAGEMVVQDPNNQGAGAMVSCSFTVPYVQEIPQKDELVDVILYRRPSAERIQELSQQRLEPRVFLEARPAVINPLVGLIVISVVIVPLIVLLPVTIPILVWRVRRKRYRIESYRVLEQKGIFVREQTSVIFSKIDHIDTSRGMFNNMFGNGNITVNTTGSSKPELVVKNIPNYTEFYNELNKHY